MYFTHRMTRIHVRAIIIVSLVLYFYFLGAEHVQAKYVLPYPALMPGNKLYSVMRFTDRLKGWWSWGSVASVKYRLSLADKYLVEGKTLFEYEQYPLGLDAIRRSDENYALVPNAITAAKRQGKDVTQLVRSYREASLEHARVLERLLEANPAEVIWRAENEPERILPLAQIVRQSQAIRREGASYE